jgi:hypothetical protein
VLIAAKRKVDLPPASLRFCPHFELFRAFSVKMGISAPPLEKASKGILKARLAFQKVTVAF